MTITKIHSLQAFQLASLPACQLVRLFAFILAVLLACLLVSSPVFAQPNITGISGILSHGSTVSITGNGFGTKDPATPLVWEDFSDGLLTPSLYPNSITVFNNTDNLRTLYSNYNARFDYKQGGNGFFSYNTDVYPKWFVQYYIKLAPNWHWGKSTYGGVDDGLANIKFFRLFPRGSRNYSNIGYAFQGWAGSSNVVRFSEMNTTDNKYLFNMQEAFTLNTWHNVQVQYGENTGLDQYDGVIKLWIDGILKDSSETINTNYSADGPPVNKRPYIIGFYDSWPPSDANEPNMYAYYTDIYVDNTWARVEIGDNPIYSSCTHREIQIPSAWSDTSIEITLNQGSFNNFNNTYLYVIDTDGNVNTNGYPLYPDCPKPPVLRRVD